MGTETLSERQRAAICRYAERSAVEQGFSPQITDPELAHRIAALLDAPGARRSPNRKADELRDAAIKELAELEELETMSPDEVRSFSDRRALTYELRRRARNRLSTS